MIVALEGSTVMLPCVNRNQIWTERHSEEEQQVVHWDRQPPGVPHDRADRLIDLYASGERRSYGPLFIRQKMNITDTAFALGDFSLRISELESADEGTYSCHLHHHYCGLHERRIYQVFVTEPVREKKVVNLTTHNTAPAVGKCLLAASPTAGGRGGSVVGANCALQGYRRHHGSEGAAQSNPEVSCMKLSRVPAPKVGGGDELLPSSLLGYSAGVFPSCFHTLRET